MSKSVFQEALQPTHAIIFSKDTQIKKPSLSPSFPRSKRKAVNLFSKASQRRLLFVARNSGFRIKSQLCLTYHCAMPDSGKKVKQQLNSFLTLTREKYPDLMYLWVLEFQKRGVPHFHFFSNRNPTDKKFREWAALTWNRILGDSPQHLLFQQHARNYIPWKMDSGKYLVKEYLAKSTQKEIPEDYHSVGRFWGNSRGMTPVGQLIIPGIDCSFKTFIKAVRITSKRREKLIKKFVKKNYRGQAVSYSLPLMTDTFILLIQYFETIETQQ